MIRLGTNGNRLSSISCSLQVGRLQVSLALASCFFKCLAESFDCLFCYMGDDKKGKVIRPAMDEIFTIMPFLSSRSVW